jgi:geranylgeranylglycerol-phosphate geranylgeranyltransferase
MGAMTAGVPTVTRVMPFLNAYYRSMRPYYFFVTGIAGWIGVAFARFLYPESTSVPRSAVVLTILFLSWGTNQIINDYLGQKEDRINAPHRPMVTGELHAGWALTLSFTLIGVTMLLTAWFAPWALIPLIAGTALNVGYEYAKGVPFLGNLVFGVMISMCTAYGYLATTPSLEVVFTKERLTVVGLVALMNGLMTYYTYFKDYVGDRRAGKVTAVVLQGLRASRVTGVVGSFLPSVALWGAFALDWLHLDEVGGTFIFLYVVTFFLQVWTGWLFLKHPTGPRAYYSLVTNFRACTCGQVMLIAIFEPELALYLYITAYVLIGFLFDLHQDHKE